MTRQYQLRDTTPYLVDLIVDGQITATLPFTDLVDAHDFGAEFVERGGSGQRSREVHPAGKRLAE